MVEDEGVQLAPGEATGGPGRQSARAEGGWQETKLQAWSRRCSEARGIGEVCTRPSPGASAPAAPGDHEDTPHAQALRPREGRVEPASRSAQPGTAETPRSWKDCTQPLSLAGCLLAGRQVTLCRALVKE